jgi:hypothetical protein
VLTNNRRGASTSVGVYHSRSLPTLGYLGQLLPIPIELPKMEWRLHHKILKLPPQSMPMGLFKQLGIL